MAFRKSVQQQAIFISDDTIVAGKVWKVLKFEAVKDGFEEGEWFKSLNERDKEIVTQLREA